MEAERFSSESHYMWQICHPRTNQNRYMWQTRLVSSFKRPQSVPPRRDFPWETATYNGNHFSEMPKLPHIGHFKMKTWHRHITFFVRSKTAFRKRHHHRRRGYRFCGGRVRAAIRRVPYRRAHGCRDATACAFRPPPR